MKPQPPQGVTPDLAHFWGGYKVEFKLIERAKFDADARDLEALRRRAPPTLGSAVAQESGS
jgi:hypothetical protein